MNNEFHYRWDGAVQIRNCPYLNNVVEQDHRRVKSRVAPMLGFKRFFYQEHRTIQRVLDVMEPFLPQSFGTGPSVVRSQWDRKQVAQLAIKIVLHKAKVGTSGENGLNFRL